MNNEMPIFLDYLNYQTQYEGKYGKKTVVLIQVGGFFEFYGIDTRGHQQKIYEIAEILNMCVAITSKFYEVEKSNVLMAGFPLLALDKQLIILIKHNYTVVLIEQTTEPPAVIERKVTNIYSPGTYLNALGYDSNNVLSLFISQERDYKTKKINYIVGLSCIDLSTAKCHTHEIIGKPNDDDYIYEETLRFIQTFSPKEIILTYDEKSYMTNSLEKYVYENKLPSKLDREQRREFKKYIRKNILNTLENKLEFNENKIHVRQDLNNKDNRKMWYINEYLKKIYLNTGMLSPIQYISLDNAHNALFSFMTLLEFSYEHNENILTNINKPVLYDNEDYLVLENSAIQQLNIISSNKENLSLFDVINYTTTSLGKRTLRERLLLPLIDENLINQRYNNIDRFLEKTDTNDYKYLSIESHLTGIIDIERYHRKMSLGIITPNEFYNLASTYDKIISLISCLQSNNIDELVPSDEDIDNFQNYAMFYDSKIIIESCKEFNNVSDIDRNIFKPNVNKTIENIQINIDNNKNYMNDICEVFDRILKKSLSPSDKPMKNSDKIKLLESGEDMKKGLEYCKINNSDKYGYYIGMTARRYEIIKSKNKILRINDNTSLNLDDLIVNITGSNVRITDERINSLSDNIVDLTIELKNETKKEFTNLMSELHKNHNQTLKYLVSFVSEIDYVKSCAKASILLNYTKPLIKYQEEPYINGEELRHPIIERINDNKYVPNKVMLGTNEDGMLLFSCNSLGKSSYMKSVGLSVVLAQMGMFVPAKQYTFFPFKNIMTRIIGNDNMYKGQSSFAVEMSELRGIVSRASSKTLVLGDEVCHGTEQTSGISLVASTLEWLSKRKVKFIFATHLHQLSKMNEIKKLKNVNSYHLRVTYDEEHDRLIYDRKLCENSGSSIYGIEVARAMGLNKDFINRANDIRRKYIGLGDTFLNNKQSTYNSKLYIKECEVCGNDGVDVHHIIFQSQADENNNVDHRHKNHFSNLVILCKDCHQSVHTNKLIIKGYLETSDGIVLDYELS